MTLARPYASIQAQNCKLSASCSHNLGLGYSPRFFRCAMLKRKVIVVNREDLILRAIDKQ